MRAALLREYHRPLELVERPDPEPATPNDVVIRIGGAGVCATDLHCIDGEMEPAGLVPPVVLGHENAGWVHATGDLVSTVAEGDAVIVYPPRSCGLCLPCRRGRDMHCERHGFTGITVDGGFADFVVVPERSVIKLPDGVEPAAIAPQADAGLTAYHAVKGIAHLLVPGTTVAVIGVGGVGHIAVQLVRELGSSATIGIDTDERRRKLAQDVGADEVVAGGAGAADAVREITAGRGADVVLDFVGNDNTHEQALGMLARNGTFSVIGFGGVIHAPSVAIVGQEQGIQANLVGDWPDLYEVLQLHARGRVRLHSETRPLEQVNEVLEMLRAGDVTGRIVLTP